MNQEDGLIQYGAKTHASELVRFLEHTLEQNRRAEAAGKRKTPVCIWGRHGIGKTEIVTAVAERQGYRFAYIAPAQFEEMGDLVGMPRVVEGEDGRFTTTFAPPDWVPSEPGPGILLIDDVNRADDRILRGIMQLLQNYELVSWKLPPDWHIVLTANPDGGDYSVTPMDDAMVTRMLHVGLEFDVKAWAQWAEASGVDERGINFVLTYPETVSGVRTTPRTLVQFFASIASIKDLDKELPLVKLLADASLDAETGASFIAFVKNNLSKLITPQEILNAKNFKTAVEARLKKQTKKETLRVDILATLATRLANYVNLPATEIATVQVSNLKAFVKIDFLPNDIRLGLAQALVASKKAKVRSVMADAELSRILLGGM